MQPQRSLFGIFHFIHVQTAASPAFIMWTTPLYGMDFLCEQREVGLDHRKRLGPIWSYRQCCCLPVSLICDQQRTPFHHGWFPLPAVLSEACHIEANMGLDLHLSHSQQTINDMNSNSHNRNGSTSSTHPLFSDAHRFISNNENWTRISSHQQRNTPLTACSRGRTTPNLISAILYVEPLESVFLKIKIKIFGGFCAVISNQ